MRKAISAETEQRFESWWKHEKMDRPLVRLLGKKKTVEESKLIPVKELVQNAKDFQMNPEYRIAAFRNSLITHTYYLDSFRYVQINLGPGTMASYLKCEPGFSYDTIWYKEVETESVSDLLNVSYENSTHWWYDHLKAIEKTKKLANGDCYLCIPDIQENLDIVAAMRGSQNLCFDLMDCPEDVKKVQKIVDDSFFKYYDAIYEVVKDEEGNSVYTAFSLWGRGKVAKLQCDFSALISKELFNEFVLPALQRQTAYLDRTMYHLDGVMALRHLDSVLSLKKLNALQWTPGAGQEDGGAEKWYPIYDKAMNAGKSLWIQIYDGDVDAWINKSKKILKRYGPTGIYFVYGNTDEESAKKLIKELKF